MIVIGGSALTSNCQSCYFVSLVQEKVKSSVVEGRVLLEMDGATETKEFICEAGNLSSSSSFPLGPMASLPYVPISPFHSISNLESGFYSPSWHFKKPGREGLTKHRPGGGGWLSLPKFDRALPISSEMYASFSDALCIHSVHVNPPRLFCCRNIFNPRSNNSDLSKIYSRTLIISATNIYCALLHSLHQQLQRSDLP